MRYIGRAGLGIYFLGVIFYWAFADAIDAWGNERDIEANPENVYSEDIGRTVTALTDFAGGTSSSTGKVSLGGETWDAVSKGEHTPRKGDQLVVDGRDGLTLLVSVR